MYLELYHGRNHPDEELDDWGFEGPVIGPFTNCHITYGHHFKIWSERHKKTFEMFMHEDMLVYDGKYYGDWVFIPKCPPAMKDRKVSMSASNLTTM